MFSGCTRRVRGTEGSATGEGSAEHADGQFRPNQHEHSDDGEDDEEAGGAGFGLAEGQIDSPDEEHQQAKCDQEIKRAPEHFIAQNRSEQRDAEQAQRDGEHPKQWLLKDSHGCKNGKSVQFVPHSDALEITLLQNQPSTPWNTCGLVVVPSR